MTVYRTRSWIWTSGPLRVRRFLPPLRPGRRLPRILFVCVCLALPVFLLCGCGSSTIRRPAPRQFPAPTSASASAPPPVTVPAEVLNPAVTQATVGATICVRGWTARIRPPSSFTSRLKRRQLATHPGWPQDPALYEEDHVMPLALGGNPTAEANLRPELWAAARRKDVAETAGHRAVCAGRVTLDQARLALWVEWKDE